MCVSFLKRSLGEDYRVKGKGHVCVSLGWPSSIHNVQLPTLLSSQTPQSKLSSNWWLTFSLVDIQRILKLKAIHLLSQKLWFIEHLSKLVYTIIYILFTFLGDSGKRSNRKLLILLWKEKKCVFFHCSVCRQFGLKANSSWKYYPRQWSLKVHLKPFRVWYHVFENVIRSVSTWVDSCWPVL